MSENKWTECGLNANWCMQAWHWGTNQPNCVDGDYYVVDNEDGNFFVYQTFPSENEKEDYDPYKEVVHKATFSTKRDAMAFVERGGGWGKLVDKLASQDIPNFFKALKGETAS